MNGASIAKPGVPLDERERFLRCVQAGWQPQGRELRIPMADESELADFPSDPDRLWQAVSACAFACGEPPDDPALLAFHAPLGLTEGAWLQGLARADNAHRPEVVRLFAGYLELLGADEAASPAAAYRGLLARHGCLLPPVTSLQFARDPRVGRQALALASLRLELGWLSGVCFPEALGFTLAYAGSASPWRLVGLAPEERSRRLGTLAQAADQALRMYLALSPDAGQIWRRVSAGYQAYQGQEAMYLAALQARALHPVSLQVRVADLFRAKARFARGYHGQASVGGKTLDAWFAEEPFDAEGFLRAFAASAYVSGPAGGRPFERLTDFGGPMFGIFSREELALMGAWLEQLAQDEGRADRETERQSGHQSVASGGANLKATGSESTNYPGTALETRELFHRLLNRDRFPAVAEAAGVYAEGVLRRAQRRIVRRARLREAYFAYTPQALQDWVNRVHAQEVARYKPFRGRARLRRAEYEFGIRQFAPAILVDGAWLQRACAAAQQDQRLHRLLLRIYADELGAGQLDWNHPNVYRRLLQQCGIELPEVREAAFAEEPDFLDAAFDLPAYLLAIACFPERWLPETLGLNLAIELSGLGAQYRFLADELQHWGLDPLIVRLHQSIDSLAGGHAALAVEAVQIHLEQVRDLGGELSVRAHWRRVWCGYRSLDAATRRFRLRLLMAFCRQFIPKRLADGLRRGVRRLRGRQDTCVAPPG